MTEQEFDVIRTELQRITTGLNKAIEQIVEQDAEIDAFRSILERKSLATPHELQLALDRAAKELDEVLHEPALGDKQATRHGHPSNVVSMSRFHTRRCRTRF